MLKETFISLIQKYSADNSIAAQLWHEVAGAYSHKKRHYHTLAHLQNLLDQLTVYKPFAGDWDTLLFSLFYHDIVYNVLKQNNEEESAVVAEKRMTAIGVPTEKINACNAQILATKSHAASGDPDTELFTDADLSILGQDRATYADYVKKIRKEYAIYPDLIYDSGRKKVLAHFLEMDRIYKTGQFYTRYEQRARENMVWELKSH